MRRASPSLSVTELTAVPAMSLAHLQWNDQGSTLKHRMLLLRIANLFLSLSCAKCNVISNFKKVLILKHFIFVFAFVAAWYEGMCAGICVLCMYCACMCVCMCLVQRSTSGVFLRKQICRFLWQGLSLEPGAGWLGLLTSQWTPGICLSLPPRTKITSAHGPAQLLRWVFGN